MSTPRAELLLHPVRIRIMQLAASAPDLTARQIADALPDVPPATLYRHLGRLVEAGLLTVIEERPVRGATEKVYALPDGDPLRVLPHREDASAEEHFRAFLGFVGALMSTFSRYLEQEGIPDLAADGVRCRTFPIYLDDDELNALVSRLEGALEEQLGNAPRSLEGPARRLRYLSLMSLLAMDDPADGSPPTP